MIHAYQRVINTFTIKSIPVQMTNVESTHFCCAIYAHIVNNAS